MRVTRAQQEDFQTLQVRVRQDAAHERLGESVPAVLRQDEHVSQVGEHLAVGDHSPEACLGIVNVDAEADRVTNRLLDDFAGAARGPVRAAQESMNQLDVEPGGIS